MRSCDRRLYVILGDFVAGYRLVKMMKPERNQLLVPLIALGFHHFDKAIAGDEISEYHVQAAIAATHARADDWPVILELYDQLFAMNPSPVVALNRAVAIAKVRGPEEALAVVE